MAHAQLPSETEGRRRIMSAMVLVVATMIATLCYQVAVNPWQGAFNVQGKSLLAYNHPSLYFNYLFWVTMAFVSALSVILLWTCAFGLGGGILEQLLMLATVITIMTFSYTYKIAVASYAPAHIKEIVTGIIDVLMLIWVILMPATIIFKQIRGVKKS